MNQTPTRVIYLVIIAIAMLAFMGVFSICLSLFLHTYADASILTAIISITGTLTGSLVTLLSSTRTQAVATGETSTSSTMTITTKPTPVEPTVTEPTPVVVTNTQSDPVPTTESKP